MSIYYSEEEEGKSGWWFNPIDIIGFYSMKRWGVLVLENPANAGEKAVVLNNKWFRIDLFHDNLTTQNENFQQIFYFCHQQRKGR